MCIAGGGKKVTGKIEPDCSEKSIQNRHVKRMNADEWGKVRNRLRSGASMLACWSCVCRYRFVSLVVKFAEYQSYYC